MMEVSPLGMGAQFSFTGGATPRHFLILPLISSLAAWGAYQLDGRIISSHYFRGRKFT